MYRAVLDTCALVPSLQRDFLLQLAAEESYSPLWGSGILYELDYVLAGLDRKRGIQSSESRRQRLFEQMRHAFPGSEIEAPKDRNYDYGLCDEDDGHVAHAAIIGKADAIVTDDRRAGFDTAEVLAQASIEVVSPAEFAANTVAAHPEAGLRALRELSRRRTDPHQRPEEILALLVARNSMKGVATIVGPLLEIQRPG
ncbi:PIN domain-containing protein [Cumulibacter manganitolerans]|uniref:PIN domain-containing protein n=1 Tax=Cumulibacter manganitolerans TaxID=1884992 RepID=UPI001297F1EA|nr:PIN domain-containing protein [Cumulibacter manganitolerans]